MSLMSFKTKINEAMLGLEHNYDELILENECGIKYVFYRAMREENFLYTLDDLIEHRSLHSSPELSCRLFRLTRSEF